MNPSRNFENCTTLHAWTLQCTPDLSEVWTMRAKFEVAQKDKATLRSKPKLHTASSQTCTKSQKIWASIELTISMHFACEWSSFNSNYCKGCESKPDKHHVFNQNICTQHMLAACTAWKHIRMRLKLTWTHTHTQPKRKHIHMRERQQG